MTNAPCLHVALELPATSADAMELLSDLLRKAQEFGLAIDVKTDAAPEAPKDPGPTAQSAPPVNLTSCKPQKPLVAPEKIKNPAGLNYWSDQEIAQLLKMKDDGVPARDIAAQLGRTLAAVYFKLSIKQRRARTEHPPQEQAPAKISPEPFALAPAPGVTATPSTPAEAAAQFLTSNGKASVMPRGPDAWLLNGLRVLTDADVIKKAQNFGFAA